MKDQFLKIETVAEMLDVNIWTVRKWIKERRIRTYRFGRSVRLRKSDILNFAEVTPSIYEMKESMSLDS